MAEPPQLIETKLLSQFDRDLRDTTRKIVKMHAALVQQGIIDAYASPLELICRNRAEFEILRRVREAAEQREFASAVQSLAPTAKKDGCVESVPTATK